LARILNEFKGLFLVSGAHESGENFKIFVNLFCCLRTGAPRSPWRGSPHPHNKADKESKRETALGFPMALLSLSVRRALYDSSSACVVIFGRAPGMVRRHESGLERRDARPTYERQVL